MWVGKFWYSEMESNGTDQESFGSVIYYLESFGTLSWKVMEPTDLAESFGTRSWRVLEPKWKVLVPWYIIPWSGVPSQGYNMPIYGWCQITWLSGGHGARSIYGLVRKQGELSRQHRHTWAWAEQDCHVSRLPSIKMRPILGKFWYCELESNGTDLESFGTTTTTRSWKVLEPIWKVLVLGVGKYWNHSGKFGTVIYDLGSVDTAIIWK